MIRRNRDAPGRAVPRTITCSHGARPVILFAALRSVHQLPGTGTDDAGQGPDGPQVRCLTGSVTKEGDRPADDDASAPGTGQAYPHLVKCVQNATTYLVIPQIQEENAGNGKMAAQPRGQMPLRFGPGLMSPPAPQCGAFLEVLGLGTSLRRDHHDGGLVPGPLQVAAQIRPGLVNAHRRGGGRDAHASPRRGGAPKGDSRPTSQRFRCGSTARTRGPGGSRPPRSALAAR